MTSNLLWRYTTLQAGLLVNVLYIVWPKEEIMVSLKLFTSKLFGLLASAIKPIAALFLIVFLLGNLFWYITGKDYGSSMILVFSIFLSLGSPPSAEFSGWLRLIEFGIDIMGLLLFAIFTAAAIKALERSNT